MFLHIGAQVMVAVKDLVAMLDMEVTRKSPVVSEFLSRARKDRALRPVNGGEPRCIVITASRVYLSSISLPTLRRRLEAVCRGFRGEEDEPGDACHDASAQR